MASSSWICACDWWLTDNVNCSRGCPGKFQVIIFEVDGKVPDSDEINYDAWYVRLFILSNKLIKRIVQTSNVEQPDTDNPQDYDNDDTQFFRRIHLMCLPRHVFGMATDKIGRLRRPIDYDKQCGVMNVWNLPCTRSLECRVHSLSGKRAVNGRSRSYDELWLELNRTNNLNSTESVKRVRETNDERTTKRRKLL